MQSWEIDSPKAAIGIIHGLGEHSSRYAHVASMLNDNGFSVYAMDHLGHGQSSGKRGHADSYDDLLDSVRVLQDEIKKRNTSSKIFLYGHSMGGNVLANYLLRRNPDIAGAVLSAPWLTLPFEPNKLLVGVAKIMRSIYPSFPNNNQLDVKGISRDPEEVKKYKEDKMIHYTITPGLFFPAFENGKWAIEHASELKIPTLLMHGSADRLTSHDGSKAFAEKAGKIVEFKSWEGFFHEIHNEPLEDRKLVFDYLVSWLNRQLTAS